MHQLRKIAHEML